MKKHLLLLPVILFVFSCGEYQKVLKSSDVDFKYNKAIEYYEKEDFARAMPLFRELTTMLRATKKSEEVMYYLAYCHYNNSDFITSSYLFKNYVSTFPNGSHVEECFFMGAYCVYMESPSYSLDATYTQKAIGELQEYINKYPEGSRKTECENLILELHNKLAYKAFENAKQYYTTEHYKSAIISLNNMLIDFPGNEHREEAHFLILKSSYELAINSIGTKIEERLQNTIDAYLVFNDNYPNSKFIKQAKKIEEQTRKSLNNLNN